MEYIDELNPVKFYKSVVCNETLSPNDKILLSIPIFMLFLTLMPLILGVVVLITAC